MVLKKVFELGTADTLAQIKDNVSDNVSILGKIFFGSVSYEK